MKFSMPNGEGFYIVPDEGGDLIYVDRVHQYPRPVKFDGERVVINSVKFISGNQEREVFYDFLNHEHKSLERAARATIIQSQMGGAYPDGCSPPTSAAALQPND